MINPKLIEDLYLQSSKKLGRSLTDAEKSEFLWRYNQIRQISEPSTHIKRKLLGKAFIKSAVTILIFALICAVIWGAYMLLQPSNLRIRLPIVFIFIALLSPVVIISLPYYFYVMLKADYESKSMEKLDPKSNPNWKDEMPDQSSMHQQQK